MNKKITVIVSLLLSASMLFSCAGGNDTDKTTDSDNIKTEDITTVSETETEENTKASSETTDNTETETDTDTEADETTGSDTTEAVTEKVTEKEPEKKSEPKVTKGWFFAELEFYNKDGTYTTPTGVGDWTTFDYWKGYEDSQIYDSHGEGQYVEAAFTGKKFKVWFGNSGANGHTNIEIYLDGKLLKTYDGTSGEDGEPWATEEFALSGGEHTVRVRGGKPKTDTWNGLTLNCILFYDEIVVEDKAASAGLTRLSVIDNGAKADGKTDDSSAFSKASGAASLYVPAGVYRISRTITVKLPITFELGAKLVIDDGKKVTFANYVDAKPSFVFDGDVILNANPESYPEWFGASASSGTDSTKAIQRAINCFPGGHGKVKFDAGKYITSDSLLVTQGHLTLEGTANQTREVSPGICSKNKSKPVLIIRGSTNGGTYDGSLEDVTIKCLEFTRTAMGGEGTDTILVENTIYTTLDNVGFSLSQNGVRAVNVNGLRILKCHGTTGGDLKGKEVRGIYIDGTKKGSAGIIISDYIYYGYASPNSITYAYKDYNGPGAVGTNVGDRRITNFECAGKVDYGIAVISDSSGWGGDIAISDISMDAVKTAGIWFKAANANNRQTLNICNGFFLTSEGSAQALKIENYDNVNVSSFTVENYSGNAVAMSFSNSHCGSVTATVFEGSDYGYIAKYDNCENCVFSTNTTSNGGKIALNNSKGCIFTSNAMPRATFSQSGGSNNIISNNTFK